VGSWCLYDYANTIFAFAVMGFYFNQWLCLDLGFGEGWLALGIGVAMVAVGISTPVIGVISDERRQRAKFVNVFTVVCVISTALIGVFGHILSGPFLKMGVTLLLFIVGNYCYAACLSFYNALMPEITTPKNIGRISGTGVAVGYLGAIIGGAVAFCFCEAEYYSKLPEWIHGFMRPFMMEQFQTGDVASHARINAFIPTAVYFIVFSIPFFLFVKDRNPRPHAAKMDKATLRRAFKQVIRNVRETRKYPGVLRFLLAKSLYEDALQTTILFMPLYAEHAIGITEDKMKLLFYGWTSIFSTAGSFVAGWLVDKIGPKRVLMGVVFGWVFFMCLTCFWPSEKLFWVVGAFLGALLGSAWTSARPLLSQLTPPAMASEFFGLYSLSGKVATIVGPAVFACTIFLTAKVMVPLWSWVTGDVVVGRGLEYRAGVLALAAMVAGGFWVLRKVPDYFKTGQPNWDEE